MRNECRSWSDDIYQYMDSIFHALALRGKVSTLYKNVV